MKTPKSFKMISQVLFVAIIAAAVAGCGKSVERTSGATMPGAGGTEGLRGRNLGPCVDPIDESADSILSFNEVQSSAGSYELVGLQSVGSIQSASGKSGIAIASMKKGEDLKIECVDMAALPDLVFESKNEAPEAIDATNGAVSSNLQLAIHVKGPSATTGTDSSTASVEHIQADCTKVDDMLPPGGVCTTDTVKVIKMANGQLGVLRITEGHGQDGSNTRNKTLAIYAIASTSSTGIGPTTGAPDTAGSDDRGSPATHHPKGQRISVNGKKGKGSNSENSGNEGKTHSKMPSKTPSKMPSKTPCKTPSKAPSKTPEKVPGKTPGKTPCKKPNGKKPGKTLTRVSVDGKKSCSTKSNCKKPDGNLPEGKIPDGNEPEGKYPDVQEPTSAQTSSSQDPTDVTPAPTTETTSPIDSKIKVKTVTVSEQEREIAKAKVKTTAEGDKKTKIYDKLKTADGEKEKTVAVQKLDADGSGVSKITHKTVTLEDDGSTAKTKTKTKIKKK